ncbi:hypothetical protein VHEMI07944 [[Torrubiella] hemipterigena]|uniref:Sister chromatid cohesion protein DCC1 n=1 Tax=[Torrubiella] hemipterigena TaxID=1531966 RepID=A0A0A1TBY8_9HYPO|nr:hypothetical protein VHEMI07944 [[Torrubiella] hemipterigena]
MASQNDAGITVKANPSQDGFRLIELPPELETLLTSPDAPVLTFESAGNDTLTVLKTPGKNYILRQKNTSNGLWLLQPHNDPESMQTGLSTIATIHETVELELMKDDPETIKPKPKGKWHERFGATR